VAVIFSRSRLTVVNCFRVSRLQDSATRTACLVSSRAWCPRNPDRACRRRRPTARRRTSHRYRRGLRTPPPARCPRAESNCQTAGTTITTSSANTTGKKRVRLCVSVRIITRGRQNFFGSCTCSVPEFCSLFSKKHVPEILGCSRRCCTIENVLPFR
jgi:hypothetical protein